MVLIKDLLQQTEEEREAELSFRTYRNYLLATNLILKRLYASDNYFECIKNASISSGLERKERSDYNRRDVRNLLFNAWYSEIILTLPSAMDESLRPYANHWLSVISYYSIYLALRAFLIVKRGVFKGDHTSTHQCISSLIKKQGLFIPPWNIFIKGSISYNNFHYVRLPNSINIEKISSLVNPDNSNMWDLFGLWLKTTRSKLIRKRKDKWKKENGKKKIPKTVTLAIEKELHPTTLFDCIHRLRIRSNYEDAEAFLMGQSSQSALHYFSSLVTITKATLFLIELNILFHIGEKEFHSLIDEFIKKDKMGGQSKFSIGARKEFLKVN